ncbi:MAG: hypothetical protein HYS07_04560 [Chlamydiae bacterium]|nr:hypothetical protein [Chlamydiota bacterium]MBI3276161.1 hypothetical protein [Chlamydiota bacterium]
MRAIFGKLKYAFGLAIGMLICRLHLLRKYKFHLLSSWRLEEKRKGLDNLFYRALRLYWFRFQYLSEKDPDKRELLKETPMEGGGRRWAEYYDNQPLDFKAKVGHLTYNEACPLLSKLDKILSSTTEPLLVVQVGSSSGREIAWLAGRNRIHTYIGTDIYPEVLAYSSKHHHLSNLSFERYSAKEISNLLNRYKGQRIIVFSSGSLQYVQPEHVEIFFDSISCIPKLQIILLEPANESEGNPEKVKGSLWRGDFSYTHNYRFYAEKGGLITQTCEILRPYFPYENFPIHRNTVHYFYGGRSLIY